MGDASKSLAPASGAGYFCTVPVARPSPGAMLACPSVQWSFARGDVFEGSGTEAWEWRPVAATTRERQRAARSIAWDCRLEGLGEKGGAWGVRLEGYEEGERAESRGADGVEADGV